MIDLLVSTALFSVLLTLAAYAAGTWVQKKIPIALFNPLLIATILVIGVLLLTGVSYEAYYEDTSWLALLLGPTIVAFAVPLDAQFRLLLRHKTAILAGVAAGTAAGLITVVLLAVLFQLPDELLLSLLPKSVTTAIGIDISAKIGGVPSITSAAIAFTGIEGAVLARPMCRLFRLTEPVARGLALGTSAHAIGTSKAAEMSELTGAISSLAIVLAGLLTVIVIPLILPLLPVA